MKVNIELDTELSQANFLKWLYNAMKVIHGGHVRLEYINFEEIAYLMPTNVPMEIGSWENDAMVSGPDD